MLRGLRKASSNWVGKVIMAAVVGFLVLSFAIWGIGDVFRGFGRSTVAKIGRTEITIEQFRQIYNDRLQQFSRQLGRPLTMDQARALGIDRQVVAQLVAEVTLDEQARNIRLDVSDAEIARRITSDPGFQAPNGQFDRTRFEQIIRQAEFTEQRFVAEQRKQMMRRQLAGTILGGAIAPKAAVEAANRYQNEQRTIDYVLLDRSKAGDVAPPTPEELAKYFEERKILFRAPEYRKLVVIALIPSEQARWIEVSDEDLKRAYEDRRSRYITPERRNVQQIVFSNAEDARAAAARIATGETFAAIAAERGLSEKDIDLGTVTKAGIIDRAVGDAAFALKEGEVSAPVQGRFGTALVRVSKIEPEQVRAFEEVAGEIKQDIATERAKAQVTAMYDKIEDERSIGKTLAEAAEELKLESRTVEVDRSGRDASGKPVALPDAQRLLTSAFTTEPGVEIDPLQVEGGYVWVDVAGITPARERTLDEVKAQVEARWSEDETATRLKTKATQILEKLKAGTPLAEVATADGLKVETKTGIKRGDPSSPLSAGAIEAIFRTAKDGTGSAEAEQLAEQVVFRVTDIVQPNAEADAEATKQLQEALNRALADDIFGEYVAQLQDQIGVTINQAALRQVVTGVSVPDDNLSPSMQIEPPAADFAKRYARGDAQVVWTTLVADLETPVSAFLKIAGGRPMSFLLESVEGGAVRGRYSIIGLDPDLIWRTVAGHAQFNRAPGRTTDGFIPCDEAPLAALRTLIAESRIELPDALPPMAAGIFGYLGYDMVRLMEELSTPNPDPIGIPDAILVRPTIVVVFDAVQDTLTVVTPVRPEKKVSAKIALTRASERLAAIVDALDKPLDHSAAHVESGPLTVQPDSNTTPAEYQRMVHAAKDYIAAGDVFQVVLSQRFSAPFELPPFALYRALRRVNPSPYLYFLDFGDFAVAGSSPEILVKVSGGTVTIRPIAGTRPRGATPHDDAALETELLSDPKERAEHLMLLDLGRNDVGRVAKIGTVTVTDQFFVERYSQVMHIVSNVEGALADPHDAIDALAAGFPAGTVSGAPKVRAMEIIDELEKEKRGLYAGSVGYFSATGEMDTAIVLRTALVKDGVMYVQAGAGIVADSDPKSEQQECVNKAKALFRAAEEARRFASAARRGQ